MIKQEDIILDQNNWLSRYYIENFLVPKLTEQQIEDHLFNLGYEIKIKNLVDIYNKDVVKSILSNKDSICLGIISNKSAIIFLAVKIKKESK